jgi:zinc transport system substrate-binding protein
MRYIIPSVLTSLLALPALAEVPRVVTDIPPVHSLAAIVMGDLGQPELLLEAGANAHNYQMRPSQVAALSDAGLVVWIGPEMTPWLARALDSTSASASRLALLTAPGTHTQDFGATEEHDHEHADHDHGEETEAGHDHEAEEGHDHAAEAESGHDHDHAEGEEGHVHTGLDPHAWLDPANAAVWLSAIATELSRIDPENAATYAANAKAGAERIAALDDSLKTRLAPIADKPFVVFHDAYGYFAGHYDLIVAGAISAGDAASPGAAHLRELRAELGNSGTLCIFPEVRQDEKLAVTMAADAGVKLGAPLDPEGAGLPPGPQTYEAILTGLADTLLGCLAGN